MQLPHDRKLMFCSFIHAGQFLNGIAGCVVMAAPPLLSNVWFPPHERITATGIATLLNYMGTECFLSFNAVFVTSVYKPLFLYILYCY